jgi:hypothetical protein
MTAWRVFSVGGLTVRVAEWRRCATANYAIFEMEAALLVIEIEFVLIDR